MCSVSRPWKTKFFETCYIR